MKNSILLFLLIIVISSCQSKKTGTIQKKDYGFITDSIAIDQQLEVHKLAGFSLVVFENYEMVYTKEFGLKSMYSGDKIDENTAFSTASIAKLVTALLCHILEEKGLINLDDPIDQYLTRWHLPESKFTKNNKPTWKQFLNHTAGTSQDGFSDFYLGDTIPTIKQSLLGQIPRYDKEIAFLFTPGTSWKYSGGGYVILQMALEDYLHTSMAVLAEEHIFSPLGLENTTMIQPNEKGFLTNVARVHDVNNEVIKSGLPITPQVGPSGLWSTPHDLATLAIEIQNALRETDNHVISYNVAKKLTEVTALKDAVGGWSYAGQRSFGFNNYDWVRCGGSNTGVGGDLYMSMTDGNGFVYLANGEKPNRFPVINNTRSTLLTILDWNYVIPQDSMQEIPEDFKVKLVGEYEDFLFGQSFPTSIVNKDGKLYVESLFFKHFKGRNENELIYLKNGLFKILDYPNLLKFHMKAGKIDAVTIIRDQLRMKVDHIRKEK